jgi:diguanylate cyclase (GGDEF)-like protein/PAS domain S-box-containing protein
MDRPQSSSRIVAKKHESRFSAFWPLVILAGSVFTVETLVMVILPMLPAMPDAAKDMLDGAMLTGLLLPVFYFFVFRPLLLVMTERKQSEARLRALLDTSVIGIIVMDQQCRVEEFNPASETLFGYSRHDVIGQNVSMLMPEPDRSSHNEYVENYLASGVPRIIGSSRKVTALHKDGSTFPMELFVDHINAGGSSPVFIGFVRDISERQIMEETLVESEEKYRELFDNANDFIYSMDLEGVFVSVNRSLSDMLGYDREELVGSHISKILNPANLAIARKMTARKLTGEVDTTQYELEIITKDERTIPVELNSRLIYKDGKPVLIQGTGRDITARRTSESEHRLAAMVFQSINEGVMITDADNRIIAVNPSFTRLTGYKLDEAAGKDPKMLSSGRQDRAFFERMWQALVTSGKWQGELWNKRKNGDVFAASLSINTILDANDEVFRRVAIFSDITQKKESDELIWRHANFDALTRLPNRRLFGDRLQQEIMKSHRSGLPMALMFIDLDRFKEVNDTFGHAHGDLLLEEAARRISECVRESDTVARMGGDEFTVILSEFDDTASIERVGRNILNELSKSFQLGEAAATISASIGITVYPDDATERETLLQNADKAMYAAKKMGRNQLAYFASVRPSPPA